MWLCKRARFADGAARHTRRESVAQCRLFVRRVEQRGPFGSGAECKGGSVSNADVRMTNEGGGTT